MIHIEKKQAPNLRDGVILSSSFLTYNNQNTASGELRRIEIEVGEFVDFALGIYVIQTVWRLTRKPVGSIGAFYQARLSGVDKPGVYIVEASTDGGWTRSVELCAFTRMQMFALVPPLAETRLRWRAWLNEPGRTLAEITQKLET